MNRQVLVRLQATRKMHEAGRAAILRTLPFSHTHIRPLLMAALALCSSAEAMAADLSAKTHHRANGFQNNYLDCEPKGLAAWPRSSSS
jgi:hypothetical protein